MDNKKFAKLLSIFMGCATLFVPMTTVLSSCKQATTETPEIVPENPPASNEEIPALNIELQNGIADWEVFKSMALVSTSSDEENTSSILSFDGQIDNKDEIKGFSGYANYNDVKLFLSSSYNTKRYNTKALDIYFDYVPKDGEGIEITPLLLDTIYSVFDTINISNVNAIGDKTPVKFSSGNIDNPEIFDVEKFYDRLISKKLSVKEGAVITQSTTSANLLGVEDPYLKNVRVSDTNKLVYLMNSPLFVNSKIYILKLDGNVREVLPLFEKEAVDGNISFSKDSYYSSKDGNVDNLSLETIQKMYLRGANANLSSVNVYGDGFIPDASFVFSNANLNNVSFESYVDLSAIPFDYVKSAGNIIFKNVLPSSMKYFSAENVMFDGASVGVNGTDITGVNMKSVNVKSLNNISGFTKDINVSNGVIQKFYGSKASYDVFKTLFDIPVDGINIDLITKLILESRVKFYS